MLYLNGFLDFAKKHNLMKLSVTEAIKIYYKAIEMLENEAVYICKSDEY